jgi:hypothetical protein
MDNQSKGLLATCKEATRLSSEALDRELSLAERTRLRLHLMICKACTNVHGQLGLMRKAMRNLPLDSDADETK